MIYNGEDEIQYPDCFNERSLKEILGYCSSSSSEDGKVHRTHPHRVHGEFPRDEESVQSVQSSVPSVQSSVPSKSSMIKKKARKGLLQPNPNPVVRTTTTKISSHQDKDQFAVNMNTSNTSNTSKFDAFRKIMMKLDDDDDDLIVDDDNDDDERYCRDKVNYTYMDKTPNKRYGHVMGHAVGQLMDKSDITTTNTTTNTPTNMSTNMTHTQHVIHSMNNLNNKHLKKRTHSPLMDKKKRREEKKEKEKKEEIPNENKQPNIGGIGGTGGIGHIGEGNSTMKRVLMQHTLANKVSIKFASTGKSI